MTWDIGIGRSLTASPSHTTQHTGPYCAIRLIRQVQIQGNESPSDSKCLSGKAILTHFTLLIRQGPLRAQPVVRAYIRDTPLFRSSLTRVLRFFQCFQTNARNRRLWATYGPNRYQLLSGPAAYPYFYFNP